MGSLPVQGRVIQGLWKIAGYYITSDDIGPGGSYCSQVRIGSDLVVADGAPAASQL